MAQHHHRPTESGQARAATGLHDAAVTLGHAGGKSGGPARAEALSQEERTQIATQGGRARGRQERQTTAKGQRVRKGAEPVQRGGPPYQGALGGPQAITGPPRGPNPPLIGQTRPGEAVGPASASSRRVPASTSAPIGPGGLAGFDQATAAMGHRAGKRIG